MFGPDGGVYVAGPSVHWCLRCGVLGLRREDVADEAIEALSPQHTVAALRRGLFNVVR